MSTRAPFSTEEPARRLFKFGRVQTIGCSIHSSFRHVSGCSLVICNGLSFLLTPVSCLFFQLNSRLLDAHDKFGRKWLLCRVDLSDRCAGLRAESHWRKRWVKWTNRVSGKFSVVVRNGEVDVRRCAGIGNYKVRSWKQIWMISKCMYEQWRGTTALQRRLFEYRYYH